MFLAKMPFGERLNIQNDRVARDFYRVVADEQRFAELWHNPQFQQIVKRLDFIYRQGLNKMKKWYVTILLLGISLLSGCNYSDTHQRTGLVYQLVVGPMDGLLHYLGLHLNHNYGLAIVIIVCLVRLILMPLMLHNQNKWQ